LTLEKLLVHNHMITMKVKIIPINSIAAEPQINIFEDKIQNYFDIQDTFGDTKFINHATGEEIKVNSKKLMEDPQYFTSIVAKLAKTEVENTVFKHQNKNQVFIFS
jgi:hypothetical protein